MEGVRLKKEQEEPTTRVSLRGPLRDLPGPFETPHHCVDTRETAFSRLSAGRHER